MSHGNIVLFVSQIQNELLLLIFKGTPFSLMMGKSRHSAFTRFIRDQVCYI